MTFLGDADPDPDDIDDRPRAWSLLVTISSSTLGRLWRWCRGQ